MQSEHQNAASDLFVQLREYLGVQTKIIRLQVISQVANKGASGIALIIFLLMSVIIFGILTLSAGYYLASLVQDVALGFLLLAAFYLLLLSVLIIFREPLIKKPLRNSITRSLFKPEE
jgi:hypothetical protein